MVQTKKKNKLKKKLSKKSKLKKESSISIRPVKYSNISFTKKDIISFNNLCFFNIFGT